MKSITRNSRTAFVILLDQSGSMADRVEFAGRVVTKSQVVAELCNEYLRELMLRCRRDGELRDYYDIAVVTYSGDGVESLFGDDDNIFIPVTRLGDYLKRRVVNAQACKVADGSSLIERTDSYIWVEPKSSGETPMHEALSFTAENLRDYCKREGDKLGVEPMVFNITDGVTSDCDLELLSSVFREIKSIKSSQGEVLLLNIHIAASERAPKQRLFPTHADVAHCDCRYLKTLFEGASDMPEEFHGYICSEFGLERPKSGVRFKGLGYNTSFSSLFMMLNIGSTSIRRG